MHDHQHRCRRRRREADLRRRATCSSRRRRSCRASVAWLHVPLAADPDRDRGRHRHRRSRCTALRALGAPAVRRASRTRHGLGRGVRPRDGADQQLLHRHARGQAGRRGYRRRRRSRSRRRSTSCAPSPRCSRPRSGRARSSSARSSTAPSARHYSGEALVSAMGLIRLLVTFALFAIALVVVLDNLGVNVTGLVAGLGVGGIAIGLAAQGIFADLFAALAIIFDRPFRRGDAISYDTDDRHGRGDRAEIDPHPRADRRGADHLEQEPARQGNPEHHPARLSPRRVHARRGQRTPGRGAASASRMLKEIVEAQRLQVRPRRLHRRSARRAYDFDVEFDSPHADSSIRSTRATRSAWRSSRSATTKGSTSPIPTQTDLHRRARRHADPALSAGGRRRRHCNGGDGRRIRRRIQR